MSRRTYTAPREARRRWPELVVFLTSILHGEDGRRVQDDVEAALAIMPLSARQTLAREWWDWNTSEGRQDDVRVAIEAFDSGLAFDTAEHARGFLNDVYDRIVRSVRNDAWRDWKP